MKRLTILCFAAALLLAGCSDNDGGTTGKNRKTVWERYTHAELLRFRGKVKEATHTSVVDDEQLTLLRASFDRSGNCLAYNPTGIEFEEQTARTRSWGVAALWYTYSYDNAGRMTSATVYEVGFSPKTYRISYGGHTSYIPTPFPLGDIEPLMLQGVSRIEAEGYLLTADGATASEQTTTTGWRPMTSITDYTITEGLPSAAQTIVYSGTDSSGEEISRTAKRYTYEQNWLCAMEVVLSYPESDGSDTQRFVTRYSTTIPCSPISKEGYMGNSTTPEFRMEYQYAENGLPKSATYAFGTFFDEEFEQHYNRYDAAGNWTSATRKTEGMEMILECTLSYY